MARYQKDPKLERAQAKAIDMETLGRMLGMFDSQDRLDLERDKLGLDRQELSQKADLARQSMANQEEMAKADREARLSGSKSALMNARANLLSQATGQPPNSPIMRLIAAADPEFAGILNGAGANPDQQFATEIMSRLDSNRAKKKSDTAGPGNPGVVDSIINLTGMPKVGNMLAQFAGQQLHNAPTK